MLVSRSVMLMLDQFWTDLNSQMAVLEARLQVLELKVIRYRQRQNS